jgi:hypothetical protein
MESRPVTETQQILTSSSWRVSQPFYDFLQSITFAADGTGEMVYGYAQAIQLLVCFRFTVPQPGRLHVEFLDTVDDVYGPMFTASEQNRHRDVGFTLEEGEYPRIVQTMGGPRTQVHHYALHFDTDPFPDGYQPDDVHLTYYGELLREE